MYYINIEPNEAGNHGNPVSNYVEGMVILPDELLSDYIQTMGFATIRITDDFVSSVTINQEAYDAYIAGQQNEEDKKWKAQRDYEPGEYLDVEGTMYKVELPIFAGSPVTPGTNVSETTIETEITILNKEEN